MNIEHTITIHADEILAVNTVKGIIEDLNEILPNNEKISIEPLNKIKEIFKQDTFRCGDVSYNVKRYDREHPGDIPVNFD